MRVLKAGDKVRIRRDLKCSVYNNCICVISRMLSYKGKHAVIKCESDNYDSYTRERNVIFDLTINGESIPYKWSSEMFEIVNKNPNN